MQFYVLYAYNNPFSKSRVNTCILCTRPVMAGECPQACFDIFIVYVFLVSIVCIHIY